VNGLWSEFRNGLVRENALLRLMIGLCSALFVSVRVENGIFMGIAATFVLVMSNIIISALRRVTPDNVRIPIFLVVISAFVTIVDLVLKAGFPAVYERLGVWIPLIVVNCMILGRAEAYAYKHGVLASALDGLGMGLGYIWVLIVLGFFRELFGTGKIIVFDKVLLSLGDKFLPPVFLVTFPGAFLTFGLLMGLVNKLTEKAGS
jgi:Na+-translocating ferredoxin:NAD+ oxidoreductase subunit E